ncbi:MAG: sel1 repeat family protein [Nitrosomonadales bacterium]|nr:sel1 repeat family protein [Nitrosomonadales bacterium]
MSKLLQKVLLPCVFLLALSSQTGAGALSDAEHAYNTEDFSTAAKLFAQLAEHGDATAQFRLGLMYSQGLGVFPSDEKAAQWYLQAAKQGLVEAQYNIATMYAKGQGIANDYRQAALWYIRAAHRNDAKSEFAIAGMYHTGTGIAQNDKLAAAWYLKAANHRLQKAQYTVGMMYTNGASGFPKDLIQAHMWLALTGDIASNSLLWVEEKMTPEQIKKAQALEQEWRNQTETNQNIPVTTLQSE